MFLFNQDLYLAECMNKSVHIKKYSTLRITIVVPRLKDIKVIAATQP